MNKVIEKPVAAGAAHPSIYAALAAAQMEMGKALKSASNPHLKNKYADLGSVMDACLPALNAHGIAVFQPPCAVEGARYVKTILAHESGETLECAVPLIVAKNDMQGFGSAVTYARRYGLMAMAGIAPEDDDGNAAAKAPPDEERRRDPARREAPAPRDEGRREPQRREEVAPRDPAAVQSRLLETIAKAQSAEKLSALNADGTNFAAAWQWLEDEHKPLASKVKAAFDARHAALTNTTAADLGGDDIPY